MIKAHDDALRMAKEEAEKREQKELEEQARRKLEEEEKERMLKEFAELQAVSRTNRTKCSVYVGDAIKLGGSIREHFQWSCLK